MTIDAVRGFAVLGILLMNIVAFGLPPYAYVDPHHYGGASGANLAAWALAYVLADGKMRALFAMLFGASMALVADRSDRPATLHYRRMGWLLAIGMAHAWLLWFGDILVPYAVTGMIAFIGLRWRVPALLFVAACCFGVTMLDDLLAWRQLTALRAAAALPGATDEIIAAWDAVKAVAAPPPARLAHDIALHRGDFAETFAARAPTTRMMQTTLLPATVIETLGYMALGLALHRVGFLAGGWSVTRYRLVIAAGTVSALLTIPVARLLVATRFDPATVPLADCLSFALRPFIALGYAAAVILLVRSNHMRKAAGALAATGRMALTNYLATTLIATTLFYGYGFGLYARLDRAALYWLVPPIWLMLLLGSILWMRRFAYGPVEWLWRALSRWSLPPLRRK